MSDIKSMPPAGEATGVAEGVRVIEQEGVKYALVPLDEYERLSETAHLLSTNENASDLAESIAYFNTNFGAEGRLTEHARDNYNSIIRCAITEANAQYETVHESLNVPASFSVSHFGILKVAQERFSRPETGIYRVERSHKVGELPRAASTGRQPKAKPAAQSNVHKTSALGRRAKSTSS